MNSISFKIAQCGVLIDRTLSKNDWIKYAFDDKVYKFSKIKALSIVNQKVKVSGEVWLDIRAVEPCEAPIKIVEMVKKHKLSKIISQNNKKTCKNIDWNDSDKVP